MKFLIDFLEAKDVTKSEIFSHLKCHEDEAKILQIFCRKYINGREDFIVIDVLQELYGDKEYRYVQKLSHIKILLELGWISQHTFTPLKVSDVTHLELLNSTVALTPSFLRLLEEGSMEMQLPEIKPYADHLEYLQDQFFRIDLYQKMSTIRQNIHEHSLGINRIRHKLELLEKRIEERIAQTRKDIVLDKFFKQKKLDSKEQIIFIALLKEEDSAGDTNIREMNTLIELISFDEYDRIKNRSLLEDGAKLIADEVIDYEEMLNPFGGITRAFYIVDDVLQSIIHPQKKKKVTKLKLDMLVKEQDIFELVEPTTSLDDVVLNPKTQKVLHNLMRQVDKDVAQKLKAWGIKEKKAVLMHALFFTVLPEPAKP